MSGEDKTGKTRGVGEKDMSAVSVGGIDGLLGFTKRLKRIFSGLRVFTCWGKVHAFVSFELGLGVKF